MFKAIFSFISTSVRTLGAVGGGIILAFVYALFGIFVLWVVKVFSFLFIEYDWITSEYIIEGYNFLFMTHFDTAQIVFGSIFGLAGFFKFIDTD